MAGNWSITKMSRYLTWMTGVAALVLLVSSLLLTYQINNSRMSWNTYKQANAARARAMSDLVSSLGYGGMIHSFKNYVIRGSKKHADRMDEDVNAAYAAMDRLEMQARSEEDIAALDAVRATVKKYTKAAKKVRAGMTLGKDSRQIDASVAISDTEALAGLDVIANSILSDELDGDKTKNLHLIRLKRAMGYGGFIHQFKNYVLRVDEPRIAKIEANLAAARTALSDYQALGISEEESAAIAAIKAVISDYEKGVQRVQEMAAGGASVADIDAAVKVSDAPALNGLVSLSEALDVDALAAGRNLDRVLLIAQRAAIAGALLVTVFGGVMVWTSSHVLLRRISEPARRIADDLKQLAEGNTDVEIVDQDETTEIGAIAVAARRFRDSILQTRKLEQDQKAAAERERDLQAQNIAQERKSRAEQEAKAQAEQERLVELEGVQIEIGTLMKAATRGDFSKRAVIATEDENLVVLLKTVNEFMDSVETSLNETGVVLHDLAHGKLDARMSGTYEGVFAELQVNMNGTLQSLEAMVDEIAGSGQNVALRSDRIRGSAEELAKRTETSAAALEEAAAAMEEISATVNSVSDNIAQASAGATGAETNARATGDAAQKAVQSLEEAAATSRNIHKIVSVIEDIAFQINLLALNAGVEAARAGESGRGFAVVASEVRGLAQRSSEAVGEITSVVRESTQAVESSVSMVTEALQAVSEISTAIGTISRQTAEAAEAVEQQASGISSVTSAIGELDAATQVNASMFEEVHATSEDLRSEARAMEVLLSRFDHRGDNETGEEPQTQIVAAE